MTRVLAIRRLREDRGVALVEFAFVLPILCTILFAIAEFGVAFNHYLTVTDAARVGARTAVVNRTSDPCGKAQAAAQASAGALAITVTCPSSAAAGDPFAVTVSYPYSIDILGFPLTSGTLTSTATDRME